MRSGPADTGLRCPACEVHASTRAGLEAALATRLSSRPDRPVASRSAHHDAAAAIIGRKRGERSVGESTPAGLTRRPSRGQDSPRARSAGQRDRCPRRRYRHVRAELVGKAARCSSSGERSSIPAPVRAALGDRATTTPASRQHTVARSTGQVETEKASIRPLTRDEQALPSKSGNSILQVVSHTQATVAGMNRRCDPTSSQPGHRGGHSRRARSSGRHRLDDYDCGLRRTSVSGLDEAGRTTFAVICGAQLAVSERAVPTRRP